MVVVDRHRKEPAAVDEREELIGILEKTAGNRQKAADIPGVSRVTLWKLLKKNGITVKTTVEARGTKEGNDSSTNL